MPVRLTISSILAVIATLATARFAAADTAPASAFVGVTVIREYGRPPLRNQTVLVRGDRIVAVAPVGDVTLPPDTEVIGRPGQILAPGLADMHVHIFAPNDGALFLANGVTTVRNMAGRPETLDLVRRITDGSTPGPTIYTSGPIIDAPQGDRIGPNNARTPDDIRRVVAAQADAGYTAVKLYENLAPDTFAAGVAAARARGMQVYAHVPLSMSLDDVLVLRIDSIEHLTGFDRALAPQSPSGWEDERWTQADPRRIRVLARRVARASVWSDGVWSDGTLINWLEPQRAFADIDAAEKAPDYRFATPRLRALWRGQYTDWRSQHDPVQALALEERGNRVRVAVLRALYRAGAPLLIGTDAPQPYLYPGISLRQELDLHVQGGFSRVEVLRIATVDAARFLHREGEFGVVAVGARADLLLLSGDPQKGLKVLATPIGVMAAGHWRDAGVLHALLDAIAARNAAAVGAH